MSAATTKALDIAIMGRTYKVTCQDEERESLLEAVTYLDQKMAELKSSGRVGNAERIAVMAALNIAHELLEARAQKNAPRPGADGFDKAEVKRRMASMQAALDQACKFTQRRVSGLPAQAFPQEGRQEWCLEHSAPQTLVRFKERTAPHGKEEGDPSD